MNRWEIIEEKMLERAIPQAKAKAEDYLCRDCLDRRCLKGRTCKTFNLIYKAFAWEITAEKAELN